MMLTICTVLLCKAMTSLATRNRNGLVIFGFVGTGLTMHCVHACQNFELSVEHCGHYPKYQLQLVNLSLRSCIKLYYKLSDSKNFRM